MTNYIVTIAPFSRSPKYRKAPRWTLRVHVPAKSRNDARPAALRKTRKWLEDRPVRIIRVEEA